MVLELRYTSNNTPIASFTVAVDRDFSGKDGGEKQADLINCIGWRSTGEYISKHFSKGNMIVVSGRLQIRDYTDRDGNKRTAAEVVANEVYFGDSNRRTDVSSTTGGYAHPETQGHPQSPQWPGFRELDGFETDGELPF